MNRSVCTVGRSALRPIRIGLLVRAPKLSTPKTVILLRATRDYSARQRAETLTIGLPEAYDRQGIRICRQSFRPLLRVMIEGKNQEEIQAWAAEIAATVKEHLG